MPTMVETHNLTRRYGATLALDHLSLQIPEGAIFGFIGPNGAGKTTTMRILTTLLLPTSGEAWVAGESVLKNPTNSRIADCLGFNAAVAPPELQQRNNLRFFRHFQVVRHRRP